MKRIFTIAILALLFFCPRPAQAGSPHYVNGSEGIKAAAPAPPGFYWRMYNQVYSANEIRGGHGQKLGVDYDMTVYVLANRFIYSSDKRILGGRYSADIIIPLVYTDFSVGDTFGITLPNHMNAINVSLSKQANKYGVSDILIDPFILSWEGAQWDFTVGMGLFIPTGEYSSSNPASPGRGFWTFMPSVGGTVYFDEAKSWSASILAHYEIHTKQKDTHQTPGDHFHFEWGIGKSFLENFEAGLAGYCSWQVTDDSGPGARDGRTLANAIGPEIGVYIPPLGVDVTLRSLWEFENRNNAQGNITTMTFTYNF